MSNAQDGKQRETSAQASMKAYGLPTEIAVLQQSTHPKNP